MTSVAVIGGGINGAGIAWELARRHYDVALFERGEFGGATSSASTKLIHGGLRYLEHGNIGLVRESLREREFLLRNLPSLVHPLEIVLPMYAGDRRSRLRIATGLSMYDLLSGNSSVPRHRNLSPDEMLQRLGLKKEGLVSSFSFFDAQTDDQALVRETIRAAVRDGAEAHEQTAVESINAGEDGAVLRLKSGARRFHVVINAVGPWMDQWLEQNAIESAYGLSLVRGSHIILKRSGRMMCGAIRHSTPRSRSDSRTRRRSPAGAREASHRITLAGVESRGAGTRGERLRWEAHHVSIPRPNRRGSHRRDLRRETHGGSAALRLKKNVRRTIARPPQGSLKQRSRWRCTASRSAPECDQHRE